MKKRIIVFSAVLLLSGLTGFVVFRPHKPHSVILSWHAPAPAPGVQVVGYNIYRSTSSGGPYVKIASRVPGLTYNDPIVSPGRTYFYVVSTVDQRERESRYSVEITAVIP
jgi:fibronectin type 3 domain-containing protein